MEIAALEVTDFKSAAVPAVALATTGRMDGGGVAPELGAANAGVAANNDVNTAEVKLTETSNLSTNKLLNK